jgi:hypothetical protein
MAVVVEVLAAAAPRTVEAEAVAVPRVVVEAVVAARMEAVRTAAVRTAAAKFLLTPNSYARDKGSLQKNWSELFFGEPEIP